MGFDDLIFLAKGFIKGWNKEKLEKKVREMAVEIIDDRVKIAELADKNRLLEDEISRLKGEKPKPEIKPTSTKDLNPPHKKKHQKKQKKAELEVDERIEVDVDKSVLPPDAKFIGKRTVIIQEMEIRRRNLEFVISRYWSAELDRVIEGEVPAEFKGSEFGPQLRSYIIYQYYKNRVPHAKIISNLKDWGIDISAGTLVNILNKVDTTFEEDLRSAQSSALKRSSRVHIDETGAKFNGQRAYTFVASNDYYTRFTTAFEKNRWISVGALLGQESYTITKDAIKFIAKHLKKPKITNYVSKLESEKVYSRAELEKLLEGQVFQEISKKQLDVVRTAFAVGALRSRSLGSPVKFIVTDDAPNFVGLVKNHQLCWVHEIRKYKLCEVFKRIESETLEDLLKQWRGFYKLMKNCKESPSRELRMKVRDEFKRICSIKTLVKPLDEQLQRTWENRVGLLLFLKYPQLPLHNNMAELDLRERVIKRKISLQNRSKAGMKAWDLMLSLASTCRKLDLSFWNYLDDRISQREAIPYLGKVINSL